MASGELMRKCGTCSACCRWPLPHYATEVVTGAQPSFAFFAPKSFKARVVPFVFCAQRRAVKQLVVGGKIAMAPIVQITVWVRRIAAPKLAGAAVSVRIASHA